MFNKFKALRKKLASKLVVWYYNRAYQKAVIEAEQRHEKDGEMIYVIDHFIQGKLLSAINRAEFRAIKHSAQKLHHNSMFWSNAYNTGMLKEQCWYHTANRSQQDSLNAKQKEVRRIAFIQMGLKKARLYK